MPRTLRKSRLHPNKEKIKIKQEINDIKSNLPLHLQTLKKIIIRKWFYYL